MSRRDRWDARKPKNVRRRNPESWNWGGKEDDEWDDSELNMD